MKNFSFKQFIVCALLFVVAVSAQAQRPITVIDNALISDSTVFNFTLKNDGVSTGTLTKNSYNQYKWSGYDVEVLWTGLTVNDTSSTVTVYNTLTNDFTDTSVAQDVQLDAGDSGLSATHLDVSSVTNDHIAYLRVVVDPDADLDGTPRVTVKLVPQYKAAYRIE